MIDDRRLIEDYLPIQAISAEASREKSVRKGHISTLHLWWARRPLVACRAAVYGALVPANRWVKDVEVKNPPPDPVKAESYRNGALKGLNRAAAGRFLTDLCKYPGSPRVIAEAQKHILDAHAERLTAELAEAARTGQWPAWVDEFKWPKDHTQVTRHDIEAGRAPRPRVLDMFAGGGAIPLEALRLGCEAYALDLNPVAYIILLCTLVYPQKYGKPDPSQPGMTGPKGKDGKPTWGGLAEEVRYWGNWVLERVRRQIGDLYPPLPDPAFWGVGGAASPASQDSEPLFPSLTRDVRKTRRHLPHWEKEGACYFVTYRVVDNVTLTDQAKDIVLENWKRWSGTRYDLWQAVVLPNHVHVLISPLPKEDAGQAAGPSSASSRAGSPPYWTLAEILHGAKSYTANEINKVMGRTGPLWQEERFDHIVRSPAAFEAKWHYIRQNPCKAGLAAQPTDYPWLFEHAGLANRPTLTPVAYLWTRTVRCKNPACGATVPLVRQTWLCKKAGSGRRSDGRGRYVALRMVARGSPGKPGWQPGPHNKVRFEVVESDTEKGLGFDPAGFSKAGNATCPFCGTVADNDYVKAVGRAASPTEERNDSLAGCPTGIGTQPMAVVCTRPGRQGKVYIAADDLPADLLPDDDAIRRRIDDLCQRTGLTVPDEPMDTTSQTTVAGRGFGITRWFELFTPRQMLCLLTFTAAVREAYGQAGERMGGQVGKQMGGRGAGLSTASTGEPPVPPSVPPGAPPGMYGAERAKAVGSYLGLMVSTISDWNCGIATWINVGEKIGHAFARQALPMVWDFAELNPLGDGSGNAWDRLLNTITAIEKFGAVEDQATVTRGSATALPWGESRAGSPPYFDAVITDPPYYDNVDYARLSDFFYVWLKRTVGHLYPEHFATETTPKKSEAVADPVRHGGSREKARAAYEAMMAQSLAEAHRVLKPGGALVVVYAHKTTLGWATLVEALRRAGFTVTEAWPLDTEMKSRLIAMETAALASSIFLVGRKRTHAAGVGQYESVVQPELEQIVRERVETLWEQGITGADLVIACVGAGLRAFTKYERVEYANGEEVPAERFLREVEAVVLDVMLAQIAGKVARGVTAVDPPSRFYVLWRYVYKTAAIEAGEAIVFSYGQHVELDGPKGLASGRNPLVEKKKSTYRLRDFTERGADEKLGLPPDSGQPGETAPLIDALHRVLWIMENRPPLMTEFLRASRVNRDQLRVLAQALSGPALKGGELGEVSGGAELAALTKLTANWKSVIEDALMPLERNR